eukprot:3713269-Pleurochrysis_carterae.AAC.5
MTTRRLGGTSGANCCKSSSVNHTQSRARDAVTRAAREVCFRRRSQGQPAPSDPPTSAHLPAAGATTATGRAAAATGKLPTPIRCGASGRESGCEGDGEGEDERESESQRGARLQVSCGALHSGLLKLLVEVSLRSNRSRRIKCTTPRFATATAIVEDKQAHMQAEACPFDALSVRCAGAMPVRVRVRVRMYVRVRVCARARVRVCSARCAEFAERASSVVTSISMDPASSALCFLCRARVLPYSVVYLSGTRTRPQHAARSTRHAARHTRVSTAHHA